MPPKNRRPRQRRTDARTSNSPAPGSDWRRHYDLLVCLALLAIALVMHWPVRHAAFVDDDLAHLGLIADCELGEISSTQYVLEPHNEHFLPSWRAWYWVHWKLFGLAPAPWHVSLSLTHGLGAVFLYLVLKRYLKRPLIAACGAAGWAATGTVAWDSPLVWVAASHLLLALFWFLAAAAAVTAIGSARPWLCAVAATTLSAASVLMMSVFVLWVPFVVAQFLWLESGWRDRRARWIFSAVWLSGMAVVVAFVAWNLLSAPTPAGTEGRVVNVAALVTATERAGASWTIAAASLSGLAAEDDWSVATGVAAAMAFGILALVAALAGPRGRALLLLFALPAVAHTLLVHVARSQHDAATVLWAGRYLYVALLGVSITLAAVLASPFWQSGTARRGILLGLTAALIPLILWQQYRASIATSRAFTAIFDERAAIFAESGQLLHEWANAGSHGKPVHALNLTVDSKPVDFQLCQLAILFAVPPEGVRFLSAEDITAEDEQRALELLGNSQLARAAVWRRLWEQQAALVTVIRELKALASAEQKPLRLPEIEMNLIVRYIGESAPDDDSPRRAESLPVPLSTLVARLFFASAPAIEVVPPEAWSDADRARLTGWLEQIDLPAARQLLAALTTDQESPGP